MEDKPKSFYEFLSNNIKEKPASKNEEAKQVKKVTPFYKALAWIVIFICNTMLVNVCWNYGISQIFEIASITFFQSIMVYTFFKILTRGLFTIQ